VYLEGGKSVAGVYMSPNLKKQAVEGILDRIPRSVEVVLGDFIARNVSWDNFTNTAGRVVSSWARKGGYFLENARSGTHKGHTIDLIFSKYGCSGRVGGMMAGSPHHPLFAEIKGVDTGLSQIRVRDWAKADWGIIYKEIGDRSLGCVEDQLGLVEACLEKGVPMKRMRGRKRKIMVEEGVEISMRTAVRRSKEGGSKEDLDLAVLAYRTTITGAWNGSVAKELAKLDDPEVFRITKRWMTPIRIPFLTASAHFETFSDTVDELVRSLGSKPDCPVPAPVAHIKAISQAELAKAVSMSPNDCAVGPDGCCTRLFKAIVKRKPSETASIFTRILREGYHPAAFKSSIVVPIPKANKQTRKSAKSWRQIHMLSVFSKTLERIVLDRLEDLVEEKLSPTQFGTRKDRGCVDAHEVMRD
jgi:hypothetical protein